MLAELRTKSQITLPKDIVTSLGLSEGDKLEISEKDGIIYITPVAVYPKKYVEQLQSEINKLKDSIKENKQPVFDTVDELFNALENS